ncbi:unnamed protein product [Hydatigera taeniaeformis]|uniref:CTNNB1_binding domain-containing protein n=1 Tax=Hydatigena taeniaeformis TaxID=6205 RepID=A0A0R3WRB2_HYDTA|nr:unnamed protein product [Hydatigera taeniaeformis]
MPESIGSAGGGTGGASSNGNMDNSQGLEVRASF